MHAALPSMPAQPVCHADPQPSPHQHNSPNPLDGLGLVGKGGCQAPLHDCPCPSCCCKVVDLCGDCYDADISIATPLFANLTGMNTPSAQVGWHSPLPLGGIVGRVLGFKHYLAGAAPGTALR